MFDVTIWNNPLRFITQEGLFSPNHADVGTIAMLYHTVLHPDDKVLDLGCGYGIVGIAIAKVIGDEQIYMSDCNKKAVETSKENARLNGVTGVKIACGEGLDAFEDGDFTLIMSNPPYHTDFSIAKAFIEQGYRRLRVGGRMVMVVKRLTWYKNKMTTVFGGVRVVEQEGYYILTAEKRELASIREKPKHTTRKHLKKVARSESKHVK